MKKSLAALGDLEEELNHLANSGENEAKPEQIDNLAATLSKNVRALREEAKTFARHYQHTSLFLETLLRKDHFLKGTYVLRKHSCNFRTEIIEPLLERYAGQFEKRGIAVDALLENVPDEQVTLFVDKGLISQVFDNFFSNALKYAREVEDQLGNRIRLFSYNRQILKDFFGEDKPGIRFNFFTTGEPLSFEQAQKIFEEGFRVGRTAAEGTGHGLYFVRNVVEIHGGSVGAAPQKYGNLIYFTLPMKAEPDDTSAAPAS